MTAKEKKIPKARFNPTERLLEQMGVPLGEAIVFLEDAASSGNDAAKKFTARWREIDKNQRRLSRFDIVAREAGVSPEEVRSVLFKAWRSYQRMAAQIEQLKALPGVTAASARAVELPDNSKERMRVLETHELLAPEQKGGAVTVNNQIANVQPQRPRGLPSFDDHMRLADAQPKQLAGETVEGEIVE